MTTPEIKFTKEEGIALKSAYMTVEEDDYFAIFTKKEFINGERKSVKIEVDILEFKRLSHDTTFLKYINDVLNRRIDSLTNTDITVVLSKGEIYQLMSESKDENLYKKLYSLLS